MGSAVAFYNPSAAGSGWPGRCNGANRLPRFYLGVENGLHIRAPRITEDRTVAERARAPFHPPLKPAEDSTFGNRLRCATAEFLLVVDYLHRTIRPRDRFAALGEKPHDLGLRKLRPPECVIHDKRPGTSEPMPNDVGRANRAPSISSGGLHVDVAKR